MEKKKFTFADSLGLLIMLFLTLSAVFPLITSFGNNAIFCLGCEILWLAMTYYDNRDNFSALFSKYSWWIVLLIYLFVVPRMFENITVSNRYTPYFIGVFGTMMFEYYYQNNKMHVIGRAVKIAAPFYFFTLVRTIYVSKNKPSLARSIMSSPDSISYLRQGVGNYGFVYMSVLIFTIAMIIFLFSNKTKPRIVSLITMALCLILFSYTNFFTALIISIISAAIILVLYIEYCVKNSERIKVLELFVLLIILFVAVLRSDAIFSFASSFIGDETTRIGSVINSGGSDSTIQAVADEFFRGRFPTMMDSLDMFIKNPFLGVSVLNRGVPRGLGQHSSILDTFALHGIIIGFAFFKMHGLPYKKYDFYQNNVEYRKPLYLALFGISFFNNLTFSLLFASTVICPYLIYNYVNANNKQ